MVVKHDSLKGMPKSEQLALVQDVLAGNDEAIATFRRCTMRLLTHIAKQSPLFRSYGACTAAEIPDNTFTYLVCGLRPTGGIQPANDLESPLQRWLLSLEIEQGPLEKYVAIRARWFMRDLLREWLREHKKLQHYYEQTSVRRGTRQRRRRETASRDCYRVLPERSSPVEESVMMSRLAEGWIRPLTEQEQAIIQRTAPMCEGLSQQEAAQSLGISNATMTRRRQALRAKFDSYLEGA